MKKFLLIVLLLLVVAVGGFAIVVALQPADFRVTRKATMNASPAEVFVQVNELKNWEAWSPFMKLDPNMKITYKEPPAGKDASFAWVGNSKAGEGSITIMDSTPPKEIKLKLDFVKPMESTANTVFNFEPADKGTEVTWTMSGHNNFIGKAMCLVMNMEKELGGSFDEGLAKMKAIVEKKDERKDEKKGEKK